MIDDEKAFTLSKFKTWVIKDYKANGGEASPLCGHQHHHHYTCMSELLVIQWKYTYLIQYNLKNMYTKYHIIL